MESRQTSQCKRWDHTRCRHPSWTSHWTALTAPPAAYCNTTINVERTSHKLRKIWEDSDSSLSWRRDDATLSLSENEKSIPLDSGWHGVWRSNKIFLLELPTSPRREESNLRPRPTLSGHPSCHNLPIISMLVTDWQMFDFLLTWISLLMYRVHTEIWESFSRLFHTRTTSFSKLFQVLFYYVYMSKTPIATTWSPTYRLLREYSICWMMITTAVSINSLNWLMIFEVFQFVLHTRKIIAKRWNNRHPCWVIFQVSPHTFHDFSKLFHA